VSFARVVLGVGLAASVLAGCSAIIGLKAPPEQDAGASSGLGDGSMAEENDATVESSAPSEGGGATDTSNPDGSANGSACGSDAVCASGHCADGVCCNNACSGTCEACNLAGSMGTCTGITMGTDPQMECVMVAIDGGGAAAIDASPDAQTGAPDAGPATASDSGASDAGLAAEGATDASPDAAGEDAGGFDGSAGSINFPDGGYTSSDTKCAGSCDGKGGSGGGSCAYPDSTTSCGTQFCNEPAQAAGFVCNSAGSCTLGFTPCDAYSCKAGACGASCTQESDCLAGYYCNSATSKCAPTFGNGLNCSNPNECTSGYCTAGTAGVGSPVCCSSDCSVPGGTCLQPGAVGECKCSQTCSAGATCVVYYLDFDGDGYGNLPGAGSVNYVGCSDVAPKPGYVPDDTDCDDHDANVHPGQTAYFSTKSAGTHTFDYDCDGTLEKGVVEKPGEACEFCVATPTCGATGTTCTASGQQATFGCGPRLECFEEPCKPPLLCPPRCSFGGCYPLTDTAFTSTVDCGVTGTTTTCGTCGGVGEAAGSGTGDTFASVVQTCH
jgi:hypothetical protein